MRHAVLLAAASTLLLFAGEAAARAYDAKELARYDASYVKCESRYPTMRGHGDEAYLNLWRITADAKTRARLAKLRSSPTYAAEKKRVVELAAKSPSPAASTPLDRQCQGLWGEFQRRPKPRR